MPGTLKTYANVSEIIINKDLPLDMQENNNLF